MNDSVRTIWTKDQQAELDRLTNLKAEIVRDNKAVIESVILSMPTNVGDYASWMMNHAEQIRDVLKPFDGRELK